MKTEPTSFPGLVQVHPATFADDRGWFMESWNERQLDLGITTPKFVQDNHSHSAKKGTLRGMHYQRPPHTQAKLVRCTRGALLDVVVDIRHGSPTHGECFSVELTAQNHTQLYVPVGFLHGFLTLEDDTEIQYKCTDYYAADADRTIRWDSIGFDWPLKTAPDLSDKDATAQPLSDLPDQFTYEGDQ